MKLGEKGEGPGQKKEEDQRTKEAESGGIGEGLEVEMGKEAAFGEELKESRSNGLRREEEMAGSEGAGEPTLRVTRAQSRRSHIARESPCLIFLPSIVS